MDRARVRSPLKLEISRDSFRVLGEVDGWEEGLEERAVIMLTRTSQEKWKWSKLLWCGENALEAERVSLVRAEGRQM